jgi:hypothetical protein
LPNDARDWQDSDGDGIGDSLESSVSENFDIFSNELILLAATILTILLAVLFMRRGKDSAIVESADFDK